MIVLGVTQGISTCFLDVLYDNNNNYNNPHDTIFLSDESYTFASRVSNILMSKLFELLFKVFTSFLFGLVLRISSLIRL